MTGDAGIRGYRPDDLEALYAVSLATGDAGGDASGLYRDPRLIGHVYVGPYATLHPELVLVAEDGEGVGGYIVGALDTRAFEDREEAEWWPALRAEYPSPIDTPADRWTADQQRCHRIHHPPRMPDWLVGPYPSHLHINLLPRLQGRGLGRRLIQRWLGMVRARGSSGVHLGVSAANSRAIGFYRACGFLELDERVNGLPRAVWFAMALRAGR
ncbi:N-acetyltransferase [Thalassobaculum fulvum]|uniref:N-acetyltransferase n=1 Tax=Thalassobaculum fulvum TaxID=1633335 RepID=A0A918XNF8_9PROT|nr:GNAT family N-acetyltransferase [Thalassobaculum fulvum]GHD42025.1 N-acetyltransferase [Thalassobaculum fulvum]